MNRKERRAAHARLHAEQVEKLETFLATDLLIARPTVYRFFSEERWADAFVAGQMRLSTLGACRGYEDARRGDPAEASEFYTTRNRYVIDSPEAARRISDRHNGTISFGPGSTGTVENVSSLTAMADSWLLCLTLRYSPEDMAATYGQFAVEVSSPEKLFAIISRHLVRRSLVGGGLHSPVKYGDSSYTDDQPRLAQMAFVKRPAFSADKEYRFLWSPPKARNCLQPLDINVGPLTAICRRV